MDTGTHSPFHGAKHALSLALSVQPLTATQKNRIMNIVGVFVCASVSEEAALDGVVGSGFKGV